VIEEICQYTKVLSSINSKKKSFKILYAFKMCEISEFDLLLEIKNLNFMHYNCMKNKELKI
jgi:hypothetical protein